MRKVQRVLASEKNANVRLVTGIGLHGVDQRVDRIADEQLSRGRIERQGMNAEVAEVVQRHSTKVSPGDRPLLNDTSTSRGISEIQMTRLAVHRQEQRRARDLHIAHGNASLEGIAEKPSILAGDGEVPGIADDEERFLSRVQRPLVEKVFIRVESEGLNASIVGIGDENRPLRGRDTPRRVELLVRTASFAAAARAKNEKRREEKKTTPRLLAEHEQIRGQLAHRARPILLPASNSHRRGMKCLSLSLVRRHFSFLFGEKVKKARAKASSPCIPLSSVLDVDAAL